MEKLDGWTVWGKGEGMWFESGKGDTRGWYRSDCFFFFFGYMGGRVGFSSVVWYGEIYIWGIVWSIVVFMKSLKMNTVKGIGVKRDKERFLLGGLMQY